MSIVPAIDLAPANDQRLPTNLDAEYAVLGALMYERETFGLIEGLTAEHFSEPLHQRLFAAMARDLSQGRVADPITLGEEFATDQGFVDLGGINFLADLIDRAPPPRNAPDYARIVVEYSVRRRLASMAREMSVGACDGSADIHEVLTVYEREIGDLARGAAPGDACLVDARTAAEEVLAEFEAEAAHGRPKGMMTGLRCIDRRLRGLRPGHLIIMAGRPSMGKTALARQAALGAASRNPHHLFPFFCLEMARREITERNFAELSFRQERDGAGNEDFGGIAYQDMSGDKLTPMERRRLADLAWKIPKNFILDDTAALSVDYVRRRVWALKRKGDIGAIFIDYLQIMQRPPAAGRNDAAVIGEMTASLKRLAREVGCAIVLLSQINRGVESRDDKRPQLGDLRESGSIEQDANAVLFPFREVYYLERAEPKEGTTKHIDWETEVETLRRRMDVICAKNRGGAVGSDHQEYFAEYDAITDVPGGRG